MEEEAKKFLKAWVMVLASLSYCYFISSKLPNGILRLFSLLPIFSLFTLLPLSLSRPIPIILLSGFITWLANFKLLLFSFNLGPLPHQNTLIKFIFFASFPIKIKESPKFDGHPTNKVLPLNLGTKLLLFVLLDLVYLHYPNNKVVFCCLMYLSIDVVSGVCALIVKGTLGLELDPPSDEPYMATSLQDFWGRRWNRMISDTLRHTVYKPTKSTVEKLVGHKWALLPAVMAAFLVSGLMHELMCYYVTRVKPTWEVTWFFVLHGVCVVLEIMLKRALGRKRRLHWAISGPLTIGFVIGTGFWLFFPHIMRNHVDVKVSEDIIAFGKFLEEMIRLK